MKIDEASLGELIQRRDELATKISRAEGALESDKQRLKKELDCGSVKEARKKLQTLFDKLTEDEKQIAARCDKWEKEWGDKV